ncbi:MAG: hypothetical protein J5881_03275, partial [Clostridia bacterium]|nr:hypothetical protein [Clostridia bacterium]
FLKVTQWQGLAVFRIITIFSLQTLTEAVYTIFSRFMFKFVLLFCNKKLGLFAITLISLDYLKF